MDNIEELIANKEFSKAIELIETELENRQDDIELLKNLGLCQVNLEKKEDAIKTFSHVVELDKEDATSHFYLGMMYKELSKITEAIVEFNKVIKLRENYFDAYKNLAILYMNQQLPLKALEIISKAYELVGTNNEDYLIPYLYANAEIMLKNNDHAIELFEEVLKINPSHIQALNTLGCLYLTKNQTEKSFEYYQKSLSLDDKNAVTHFNIASWYLVKNDLENAKKHFEFAYKYMPTTQHLSQLALVQFKSRDFEHAAESYQKLSTKNPESLSFRFNYACCLYETQKYTQAISILLPIVQQNPKSAALSHKLAQCFEAMGQIKNAALIYEKIIKLGKIPAEIYLDYANLLVLDNDYPRAENMLKKLLQIHPDLALAHKDLGVIYLLQRLFDEAKDEFKQAYDLNPNEPMVVFEYANYFQAVSEFSEAEKYYKEALELIPDNENLLLMCGLNQMKLRNFDEAKEFLEKVLAINPKSHTALYNIAQICFTNQNFELAKEYLTDAYAIDTDIETTNLLALTYMELQDYHNAKVLLNKLNNEYPNNTAILTTLAKAEMLDDNADMAKNYLEQVLAIFPESVEAQELMSGLK